MASTNPNRDDEAAETAAGEDEDTGAQITPIVALSEVTVTTGEEDEDVLLDLKSKLYRFDKEGNQWKERGTGNLKLLKHQKTKKVRLVMRQAKTLKICANHLVLPSMKIQEHAGNDKSCVWHAADFADGELKEEMFCIRFGSVEKCRNFIETIESITESLQNSSAEESKESSEAAELLLNLRVDDSKEAKDVPSAADSTNPEDEKSATESKAEEQPTKSKD
ncbi:ran-binding protein 1 homolog c-like [Zingiber officinale]|uniref:ran-binding protein 1 homolog c-like n=1 Tax=Zingiber officinale TaxID=94328 RepID=UPI001C4AACD6|nr:ran-binding protein 1 homolog c-like [Zingiber officinale]